MLSKDSIPQMLICALQVPTAVVSFTRLDYDLALLIHCQYYFWQKTFKVTGMIMENGADRVEEEKPVILFHARDALCILLMQEREAPEQCWSDFTGGNPSVLDAKTEAMAQWVFSHVHNYCFKNLAVLVTNILKEEGSAEMMMMGRGLTFRIEQSTYALLTQETSETQARYLLHQSTFHIHLTETDMETFIFTYIFHTS